MLDSIYRFAADINSSQVLANLIAAVIGAMIGGGLALLGVRQTLKAQIKLQRQDWQRHNNEKEKERRDRQKDATEQQASREIASIAALAIEALFNSISLLSLVKSVRSPTFTWTSVPPLRLLRRQLDENLPLIAERLTAGVLPGIISTYMTALNFQVLREGKEQIPFKPQELKELDDLSTAFAIVFRTLGQLVFSRDELEAFETTLRIAQSSD